MAFPGINWGLWGCASSIRQLCYLLEGGHLLDLRNWQQIWVPLDVRVHWQGTLALCTTGMARFIASLWRQPDMLRAGERGLPRKSCVTRGRRSSGIS